MTEPTAFHPIQSDRAPRQLPTFVTLRAYEVYRALFGEQTALIVGHCRGGFSVLEIIAFLYAYPFPRAEWQQRFEEALEKPKAAPDAR